MTDTDRRVYPACASVGLTLLVLIIVAAVFQIRSAFTSLAPSYFVSQGWELNDIAPWIGAAGAAGWIVAVLLAVLATFVCARSHMGWFAFIMSPSGRASRSQYWLKGWLPLTLATLLALLPVAAATFGAAVVFSGEEVAAGLTVALLIPYAVTIDLLLLWPSLAIVVKRLHDRGKSAWFLLLLLVPLIGQLWLLIEVGFLPGQRGDNRYGPDPLASGTGID